MNIPQCDDVIRRALAEDIGPSDITSTSLVPSDRLARARLLARESGVLAGLPVFARTFEMLDAAVAVRHHAADGASIKDGDILSQVEGPACVLLSGERTALNFVQRLSGIATQTARAVSSLPDGSRTRILDTRKTTPGMRALEKYAVGVGGGTNHRFGLYDAVLIKNNHLKFATPAEAVRRARQNAPVTASIEVEVETFEQLRDALTESPDIIMLDNMTDENVREALAIINGRARVEVSGNVTVERIAALSALGVDYISMGALTHSARALDLSLRFEAL